MHQTYTKILLATAFLAVALPPVAASAALPVLPGFNPNVLISDSTFRDASAIGSAAGIQKFLESKGSPLANTSLDFLSKLSEPSSPAIKQQLGDPGWNSDRLRTAAELIWDCAQASGINPQVILVTLNKEQGLITSPPSADRLQRALNHSLGFDCPDGSACGNLFPGFYYQCFGNVDAEGNRYLGAAKSLMRSYNTPGGRGPAYNGRPAKVGESVTIANTVGDYAGVAASQVVTIGNLATAALYRYTPHVFNGNYNFWKFFKSWFRYANGTLLSGTDGYTYIIENGQRQRVTSFVAASRKLDLSAAVGASSTELEDYPIGPPYGPADNTVIAAEGKLYVFLDGVMHPATDYALLQRKLDVAGRLFVPGVEAALFTPGSQLTPPDGSVLRGLANPDVYLVENGVLRKFSEFTLAQYGLAKKVARVEDEEIALYPKEGYVVPKSGTLIKAKGTSNIYVVNQGRRQPLTAELFKNLGYRTRDVVTLTTIDEIASIPLGTPATPREGTFFSMGDSNELFLFKNGAKHPVYPYVAKQRGITADYAFEASIVSGWPDGIALAPMDGTLLRASGGTTYFTVIEGQLRELTTTLIANLAIVTKKANIIPASQLEALARDGYATPAEGTYFKVAETGAFYRFEKGVKRAIYPLVAKQRRMSPDWTFPQKVVDDWSDGVPVALRDGTLVKGSDAQQVYLVSLTKLRPLTDAAFTRRGYKAKNVNTIPQAQIDAFPKGDAIKR
jgi:hypothetical protein